MLAILCAEGTRMYGLRLPWAAGCHCRFTAVSWEDQENGGVHTTISDVDTAIVVLFATMDIR